MLPMHIFNLLVAWTPWTQSPTVLSDGLRCLVVQITIQTVVFVSSLYKQLLEMKLNEL